LSTIKEAIYQLLLVTSFLQGLSGLELLKRRSTMDIVPPYHNLNMNQKIVAVECHFARRGTYILSLGNNTIFYYVYIYRKPHPELLERQLLTRKQSEHEI